MKKLFLSIIVLGLLLSGNAYAKDVKLICKDIEDDSIFHIFIINDKNKTLKVEIDPGKFDDANVGVYNSNEIDGDLRVYVSGELAQQLSYNIDRRTGILITWNLIIGRGAPSRYESQCELFKKNKF